MKVRIIVAMIGAMGIIIAAIIAARYSHPSNTPPITINIHDRILTDDGTPAKPQSNQKQANLQKDGRPLENLKPLKQTDISTRQQLRKELDDAENYIDSGTPDSTEEALNRYHEVLKKLPSNDAGRLNRDLLRQAQEDEEAGYKDHAASKYRVLFKDYGGQ